MIEKVITDTVDGWRSEVLIDLKKKKFIFEYFLKNRKAKAIEVTGVIAKNYIGYLLIEKDCRNIEAWLKEIQKLRVSSDEVSKLASSHNNTLIKALFLASLTTYAKIFTTAKERGVKLEKSWIDSDFKLLHEQILHMRNNYSAHSGDGNYEHVLLAMALKPKAVSGSSVHFFRHVTQANSFFEIENEKSFTELVSHVQGKVKNKLEKLEYKILQKEFYSKEENEIYKKAKNSLTRILRN